MPEHNNFTHGLKLGIALSRYFAEVSEKTGWMGRLLNKKSPGSRSTERTRRGNGLREQQQRHDGPSDSSSVAERVKNWFRSSPTKGKAQTDGDNVYEPLRLQQPQHQTRSSSSYASARGSGTAATSSTNVSSDSKQKVSQNLDDIFRQLR